MAAILVDKLSSIDLGRQGENLARTIEIDVNSILEKWPDASITLLVKRKGDTEPYPAETSVVNGILLWPVTKVDTANAGEGKIEIHAVSGEIIAKSVIATIRVSACLAGTETSEVPEAAQGWVDSLIQKVDDMKSALEEAKEIVQDAQSAPAIVADASGAMVTVMDGSARPVMQLASTITPTQPGNGDPSPDNVRTISGFDAVTLTRTGKNLLGFRDFSYTAGAYIDTCANGVFHREVTTYHETSFAVASSAMQYIENPHIQAGTYTFTLTYISDAVYINPYLEVTLSDGSVVNLANGKATTLPLDGTVTGVRMTTKPFAVGVVIEFVMQLEAGAGTDYEPYNGVSLTAALPETVYGGTLDWTTGLLTVTHFAQTYDGSEAWADPGNSMTYTLPNSVPGKAMTNNEAFYHLCSHYKPVKYRAPDVQADMSCYTLNGHTLCIKDTSVGTLEGLKAYLAAQAAAGTPMTVVWRLRPASYVTHQLTPQQLAMLKGCNAVRSDTGETSVVYIADTKLYIDSRFAELQNAILAQGANI